MANKRKSQPLFDTFKHVSKVRSGEVLRFRDERGRLTKFDGRKKLVAEIWRDRRTDKVLNRTKKGKPIPQKFDARVMRKRQLFLKTSRQGPRKSAVIKEKRILIDARLSIEDNIDAKMGDMLTDVVTYSRRGNGAIITVDFEIPTDGGDVHESINFGTKGARGMVVHDLAAIIISRMYRHARRMSNLKISPLGKRGKYVRSISPRFTWTETKRLKDL